MTSGAAAMDLYLKCEEMVNFEVDLFSNGDEQGAARRMGDHINKNITHDAAPKWIDDFTALIQGNIEAGTETP
ncbi:MAG: hypothetical protein OSA84_09475 [Akkermansiaceae bacterium]|nr:hypothetical protein [Akkermansiaceae bacterium]